ncbi:MAG: HAD family hydrolase, partial [Candidatus Sericytochromatia bacterium]
LLKDPLWSPEVWTRLDQLLAKDLKGQVAVFDADGTLWRKDAESAFISWLNFRDLLRPGAQPSSLPADDHYHALRARSPAEAARFATGLLAGLQESQVRSEAQSFFQEEVSAHIYTSQLKLIRRLQAAGAEVWIVSSLNQWLAETGARALGVPAERVIGARLAVVNGKLTPTLLQPLPSQAGKVEAIRSRIGRQPWLAVGDGSDDIEMLSDVSQLRLVIHPVTDPSFASLFGPDSEDAEQEQQQLYDYAHKQQWLIQTW